MSNDFASLSIRDGNIVSPSNSNSSSSLPSSFKQQHRTNTRRAHKGKNIINDPEIDSRPYVFPDDITGVYQAKDMGDNEENINDLFIGLKEHQAWPSRGEREKSSEYITTFIIHVVKRTMWMM